MEKIRVLLVDDQEIVREGLKAILATDPSLVIAGEAENGNAALLACQGEIDVVLMDIRMPECDGVEGTRLIRQQYPRVKVLILTTFEEDQYIAAALSHGASGYLLKDAGAKDIISAIHAVNNGSVLMHPRVAQRMLNWGGPSAEGPVLTKRELDIVRLVAEGLSNQEIAATLHVSLGTVKNHLTTIYEKLELRDRTALAIWATGRDLGKRS